MLESGLTLLAAPVAGFGLMWWRGLSWGAGFVISALVVPVVLLRWWLERRHRGCLLVSPERLVVETHLGCFDLPWSQIHRVHRFEDRLIFETVAPHRRHTLSFDGHDHQRKTLMASLVEHGRTLDLRWVETLADTVG